MVLQAKSTVVILLICCIVTVSCNNGKKTIPVVSVNTKIIPSAHCENVSSLISDSGIVRYRLEAKVWDMYSDDPDPYWYFPAKIHVEQFDSLHQVAGSIVADTAYNYVKKGLWRAIGNVVVKNVGGTTFETSELFWNSKAPANDSKAFYTHQKVKITNPDGTFMYGNNGFSSNQDLKPIFLFSAKGEVNVDESAGDSLQQNAVRPDSLKHP